MFWFVVAVSDVFESIQTGVSVQEFKRVVHNVTVRRRARDEKQVDDAIEFLYTWWVNPDNSTARRKMLIDVSTTTRTRLLGTYSEHDTNKAKMHPPIASHVFSDFVLCVSLCLSKTDDK